MGQSAHAKPPYVKRLGAYALDLILFALVYVALAQAFAASTLALQNTAAMTVLPWVAIALVLALSVCFLIRDVFFGHRGVGKRRFGLRVIRDSTGEDCPAFLCALRTLALVFPLEWIWPLVDSEGRRLADLVLGTRVVDDQEGKCTPRQRLEAFTAIAVCVVLALLPLLSIVATIALARTGDNVQQLLDQVAATLESTGPSK